MIWRRRIGGFVYAARGFGINGATRSLVRVVVRIERTWRAAGRRTRRLGEDESDLQSLKTLALLYFRGVISSWLVLWRIGKRCGDGVERRVRGWRRW